MNGAPGWYLRRRPTLTRLLGPAAGVSARPVTVSISRLPLAHRATVVFARLPTRKPIRLLQPIVSTNPRLSHRGGVVFIRPPLAPYYFRLLASVVSTNPRPPHRGGTAIWVRKQGQLPYRFRLLTPTVSTNPRPAHRGAVGHVRPPLMPFRFRLLPGLAPRPDERGRRGLGLWAWARPPLRVSPPLPPPPLPAVRKIVLLARADTLIALLASRAVFSLPANRASPIVLGGSEAMSVQTNISIYRGEDVTLNFTMSPVLDVSGWNITLKVASSSGAIVITALATITLGSAGTFSVQLASALTVNLPVGLYTWDCRREDAGQKTTLANGYLTLLQEITV